MSDYIKREDAIKAMAIRMNMRSEAEIKAYIDGYNDCFKQFCECFKKMELYRVVVNNVVEKEKNHDT